MICCSRASGPHDEIQALAFCDIISTMASVTAMHNAMTNSVLILKACLAMICCSLITTELKPCALEVLPQADVEGDVTIIRVHVQTQVFANLVAHHKGVVPIEVRSNTWKESESHSNVLEPLQAFSLSFPSFFEQCRLQGKINITQVILFIL